MSAPAPRLRLGMVGGGQGAFIGAVHLMASRLDGQFEFVAGALSSTPERARASGEDAGLAPDRIYTGWAEMAEREAARPDGIEAVAIVTPNHAHFEPAMGFLDKGIHVICEKPVAPSYQEFTDLWQIAKDCDRTLIEDHNYRF
ncbi:MAG: Gfo/Idh/MocA family oxidoreductase, partial [Pseudomonadota bacterium]